MTNRLVVAYPLYLSVPAAAFVRSHEMDRTHVVDTLAVRKLYLAKAMTDLVAGALNSGIEWDRIVIVEADMLPPADAFTRIAHYPEHLDIVGSMYFGHDAPHHPIVYSQFDDTHFTPLAGNQVDEIMAAPGLYPVDAVGLGFTSISRRMLEQWDPDVLMFGGEHQLGHDLWFCRAARRQGFTVHVDSGIEVKHLTEVPIGYSDTKR